MARPNAAPDSLHWWSPRKIILQIILLQLAYTITGTILMTFLVLVMGAPFQLDLVFSYERYRLDNVFGWSLSFLSTITAIFTVLYLVLIVRRSQLILDFVLTLQFYHLLFTTWYNWHFPVGWLWWGTKSAETAIMIVGGHYFCRLRELKPIEFGVYEMVPTDPQQQEDIERQNQDG